MYFTSRFVLEILDVQFKFVKALRAVVWIISTYYDPLVFCLLHRLLWWQSAEKAMACPFLHL